MNKCWYILKNKNLISIDQLGFRSCHSIITTLTDGCDNYLRVIDRCLVYLSKAFDWLTYLSAKTQKVKTRLLSKRGPQGPVVFLILIWFSYVERLFFDTLVYWWYVTVIFLPAWSIRSSKRNIIQFFILLIVGLIHTAWILI